MIDEQPLELAYNATTMLAPLTGIGRYVAELAAGLTRQGAHIHYFAGGRWAEEAPQVFRGAIAGAGDSVARRAIAAVPGARATFGLLQQRRFGAGAKQRKLMLYHEPAYLAYRFSGPTVVTAHDASWVRYPETHPVQRVRVMNRLLPTALEQAQRVIVVSDFVAREMNELFDVPMGRLRTIYHGVSASFQRMTATTTHSLCHRLGLIHGQYVLAVGTLEPRKNLNNLIRAYRLLPPDLTRRFPLAIAGMRGWLHKDTDQEIAALERQGIIRALGYVAEADLPALYAASALFVYPSIYEGFGLPPLEAMAAGVPVIVADRASLPEVVGDAALRVDPYDVDALAQAIRGILEDTQRRERMAQAGVERASLFSWDRCARETLAVYREAIAA